MRQLGLALLALPLAGCASFADSLYEAALESGKSCKEIERMCRRDCDDQDDRGACEFDCFNDRIFCDAEENDRED
ncbi:MAG: hypothetical protein AAF719_04980 [Pseudomonadota bacterium]